MILVMWISMGLVSIALYFSNSMVLEYRASENSVASIEAAHAVEGAGRYISYILENQEEKGCMPDDESYESEEVSIGNAKFWIVGRTSGDEDEINGGQPVFGIVSEASKLNLNTATLEMLEALPGMTTELAASIIDWRDTDMEITPNGAESEYYLMQDQPYHAKDGKLETMEELRLILGGDPDLLYGEDANRNGLLDPNEDDGENSPPSDNTDGTLDPGILEYVTVFSREPDVRDDGSPRVNITGAPGELDQLLREKFGAARAGEIRQALGPNLRNIKSVLEFYFRSRMTPEEFKSIENEITTSGEGFREGLVDVTTAPAPVLECLPGVGEEYASRILAERQDRSTDELHSLVWVADILGEEGAAEAGPFITTRSYQFSVDVAAVGGNGRGFRRDLFVFDTSGDNPVVLYRRDLTRLGWPLGTDIRSELEENGKDENR